VSSEPNKNVPAKLFLENGPVLDLSKLTESQRNCLLAEYGKGMIALEAKAKEMNLSAESLRTVLDDLTTTADDLQKNKTEAQIKHTQTSQNSKTEIVIKTTMPVVESKNVNPNMVLGLVLLIGLVLLVVR